VLGGGSVLANHRGQDALRHRNDGEAVVLGGMWEVWRSDGERLRTSATLTTGANPTLALIQERMPAIIERADWPLWFGEADGDVTRLLRSLPA
jgi:putative SOS response-associated peptidase YedK